ncbi:MAG: 4-hydroxybenzoate polyprenyltransferase [Arenicella sp.]|jgi:4-hydroxybenzoate polyprenyltransferase
MQIIKDIPHYLSLMRADKPIGWLLLMWPTLWAVWIAGQGHPDAKLTWIFVVGVIIMRSAGCVINDYADKDIDPLVDRTTQRPLAAGYLSPRQGIGLFVLLGFLALCLLMMLPMRVWPWSIPAVILTIVYPYMKRFIQAPQMVLGLAFSFSIPMVYVAMDHSFDQTFYLLILSNFFWVMVFDTQYAMSDREDDLKVGVKSTAILFGKNDKKIILLFQLLVIGLWVAIAFLQQLNSSFYLALLLAGTLFAYQQWLIRDDQRLPCFQAFLNNGWLGGVIWFGLVLAK